VIHCAPARLRLTGKVVHTLNQVIWTSWAGEIDPCYSDDRVTLFRDDCRNILRAIPDASIDAIVTDPPYELAFMGHGWDSSGVAFAIAIWRESLRVLKPGGHLLAFGGSRTWHRLAVAIEDAGFEIRDSIAWLYGSGFPKSMDVSKAIDKARDDRDDILRVTSWLADQAEARGVTRADVDAHMGTSAMGGWWLSRLRHRCQVPRWGQWLKLRELIGFGDEMDTEVWRLNGRKGTPGNERTDRIVTDRGFNAVYQSSRHTINSGTPVLEAAAKWNGWGTALKPAFEPIVVGRKPLAGTVAANVLAHGTGALNIAGCRVDPGAAIPGGDGGPNSGRRSGILSEPVPGNLTEAHTVGRWPTNVVLDDLTAAELDEQSGILTSGKSSIKKANGASRFFPVFKYQAKAPARERPRVNGIAHPTVKPLGLARWLVRLVTPPGGTVLDLFAGSGTIVEAALCEGFHAVAVEYEPDYIPLIRERVKRAAGGSAA
jgi:DNA modification methylase